MNKMKKLIHKSILIFFLSFSIYAPSTSYAQAPVAGIEQILVAIWGTTLGILYSINQTPTYIKVITEMCKSWMKPDDSTSTANDQAAFTLLGTQYDNNIQTQNSKFNQLQSDLLGVSNANPGGLIYANDITYSTLLGNPILSPDPRVNPPKGSNIQPQPNLDPAYNYLQNAAGLNVSVPVPSPQWTGNATNQANYRNFFKTLTAVQTYNAYVLSQLYAQYQTQQDNKNNKRPDQTQYLIDQATAPDWFKEVSTEELGKVIRQILMFSSQSYVLLSQMAQTEQQISTSIAMSNSLLILANQNASVLLLQKAQGKIP